MRMQANRYWIDAENGVTKCSCIHAAFIKKDSYDCKTTLFSKRFYSLSANLQKYEEDYFPIVFKYFHTRSQDGPVSINKRSNIIRWQGNIIWEQNRMGAIG